MERSANKWQWIWIFATISNPFKHFKLTSHMIIVIVMGVKLIFASYLIHHSRFQQMARLPFIFIGNYMTTSEEFKDCEYPQRTINFDAGVRCSFCYKNFPFNMPSKSHHANYSNFIFEHWKQIWIPTSFLSNMFANWKHRQSSINHHDSAETHG